MTAPSPQPSAVVYPRPELADVVVDWGPQTACNYRCHYCWSDGLWNEAMAVSVPSTDFLLRCWRRFGDRFGRAQIQLVGGEPTLIPDLLGLIEGLQDRNTLNICTNLSRGTDFWGSFSRRVDPRRCTLDASYHPQFTDLPAFTERLGILSERNFFVKAVAVAYPPHLEFLKEHADEIRSLPVHFRVQPFVGRYAGRPYPESYSEEDRSLMRSLNRNTHHAELDGEIEIQTGYFLHERKVGGRLCWAGRKFIAIAADGTIQRCGLVEDASLGNFYEGRFTLYEEPKVCDRDTCHCDWRWVVDERDADLKRKGVSDGTGLPVPLRRGAA